MGEQNKEYLRCRVILEVMGKPKQHVEDTIKKYVKEIREIPDIMVVKEEYMPIKELDKLFSSFVEIEMAVKSIITLVGFCFDYMPSSIEIVKPEKVVMPGNELSGFLNDLLARLHSTDMMLKTIKARNLVLKKNLNNSFINLVSVLLSLKGKLSLEDLSRFTGINKEELTKFIDSMIKDNKIKKEDGVYILVK